MAKRTRFAEYKDRYNNCKFELSATAAGTCC
jgi:hypothetical protein